MSSLEIGSELAIILLAQAEMHTRSTASPSRHGVYRRAGSSMPIPAVRLCLTGVELPSRDAGRRQERDAVVSFYAARRY